MRWEPFENKIYSELLEDGYKYFVFSVEENKNRIYPYENLLEAEEHVHDIERFPYGNRYILDAEMLSELTNGVPFIEVEVLV